MSYSELNKSTDKELQDVIQNYLEQEDLVKEDEKALSSLESISHRTKKQDSELKTLKEQYEIDVEDLKEWKRTAKNAEQLLKEREQESKPHKVVKSATPTRHTTDSYKVTEKYKRYKTRTININQIKGLAKSHIRRWLARKLTKSAITNAYMEIDEAKDHKEIEMIYDHYKKLASGELSSSEPSSSAPIKTEGIVMPKPPKHVSQSSSTAQTQTLVPHDAFKFKEKGSIKYLQPISPEKAEELETKIKTVQSVVILDPNRYKRRPYVVKSSR